MMAAMLKTALAAICAFTLLATAYLTASLLILRPPRANYQPWALVASAIIVQGALTLVAMRAGSPGSDAGLTPLRPRSDPGQTPGGHQSGAGSELQRARYAACR
jgi:hypothetical protein